MRNGVNTGIDCITVEYVYRSHLWDKQKCVVIQRWPVKFCMHRNKLYYIGLEIVVVLKADRWPLN